MIERLEGRQLMSVTVASMPETPAPAPAGTEVSLRTSRYNQAETLSSSVKKTAADTAAGLVAKVG
jgi:hypothetical protein